MKTRNLMLSLVLAGSLGLVACQQDYGHTVEQGRCVAFDGKTVSFVRDKNVNPKMGPVFDTAILKFTMPSDPKEIGPEPKIGNLVTFNADKATVTLYTENGVQDVNVESVNVQKGVESHNSLVKGKTFPMIDSSKNEVTVYSMKTLFTFKIPSGCPADEKFWTTGDMVRVFSKDKKTALRFMNVTKTNIFKK